MQVEMQVQNLLLPPYIFYIQPFSDVLPDLLLLFPLEDSVHVFPILRYIE